MTLAALVKLFEHWVRDNRGAEYARFQVEMIAGRMKIQHEDHKTADLEDGTPPGAMP